MDVGHHTKNTQASKQTTNYSIFTATGGPLSHGAATIVVSACRCVAAAASTAPLTDANLVVSGRRLLLYIPAKRLSCNLLSLSLRPRPPSPSRCTFHLQSVCVWTSVSVFARLLIYSLHSPSACVNISVRDKGTEGGCWLLFASVLQADTGGNKWRAGSCPALSLRWLPSPMAISRR